MEDLEPVAGTVRGRRFRRNVVAVGAALGLTLGGLGVAAAQTQGSTAPAAPPPAAGRPPGPGPDRPGPGPGLATAAKAIGVTEAELRTALESGKSIADLAKSKNVEVKVVIDAIVAEHKAKLAEEVKAGHLTQAQADERAATLEQRVTDMVNHAGLPAPGGRHGPGGPGGPGGPDHGPGPGLATAAKAIGISDADLQTALRSGQSIAQVAQAKGVDPKVVIDAIVAEAKTNLEQRITEMVNHVGGPGPGPGRGPGRGPGGGHRGP
ncbi:MAG: hypothetical protein ABIS47_07435 [Acidimicrobiales bacterium]